MPDTFKPRTHIIQVDYIRAIASLAVALFHLGGKALPVLKYGWLGVQLFFVLSGFVICWAIPQGFSWRSNPKFIYRRIVRIEPPYVISIGLILLVNYLTQPNYQADWVNVLFHLAYINSFLHREYLNPVYWTLAIEFQFYIFIALCYPLIQKPWGNWLLLLLCALPFFITAWGQLLLGTLPFFCIGIVYNLYLKKQTSYTWFSLLTAAFLIMAMLSAGWMPAAAALIALVLLMLPLKSNAIVSFFSKISFSLYLTHDVVGSRLVVYLGTLLPKTVFYKSIDFTTGIIASIAFAYLFYRLIEAPFLKLSKRISYS